MDNINNINFNKNPLSSELFNQDKYYEDNFEKINTELIPSVNAQLAEIEQKVDVDIPAQLNETEQKVKNLQISPLNVIDPVKFSNGKFYGNTIGVHSINDIFETTSGNNIFGVYDVADGQVLQIPTSQNIGMTIKLYDTQGILRATKTNVLRNDTPLVCSVNGYTIGYFSVTSTLPKGSIVICIGNGTLTNEYLNLAASGYVKQEKEYNDIVLQNKVNSLESEMDKINAVNTTFVSPSEGIEGINAAILTMPASGGTIILGNGTYTNISGTSAVVLFSGYARNNIRIVGQGYGTVINRVSGINDILANQEAIKNNVVENVRFANSVQRNVKRPEKALRLISCWIGDEYINETEEPEVNIMTVGAGRQYEKLSDALAVHYENQSMFQQSSRWEIHIYGHIVETTSIFFGRDYIDFVGHNALVEIRGNKDAYFRFLPDTTGYDYGESEIIINVRDIHFLKTGCYNYWDNQTVDVQKDTVKFYNCIFENRTSSPSPFNQSEWSPGAEDTNGSRRHGITISCPSYGRECKTEFHNCIAIGSPYGFQNTRGFYISYGSPKLYNCIGIGGGIGEYGHGIVSHRGSQAELNNCIGYASKTAYRNAAGIRFQAHGMSTLQSCKGYASNGQRVKSDGVSAQRITAICTELGISSSPYVIGGVVQYSALTDAICEKIKTSDVRLVPLEENTESGYGISLWANNSSAKIINSEGYTGSGDNSNGLHVVGSASPVVVGGYFGKKDESFNLQLNNAEAYALTDYGNFNRYSTIRINKATLTISGVAETIDTLIYIETDEAVPQTIVNGFNIKNKSSISALPCLSIKMPTNKSLKIYVMQNGTRINDGRFKVDIEYSFAGVNSSAVMIGEEANPKIIGAVIKADVNNKAIESTLQNLNVFDCALSGEIDGSLTFVQKTNVGSNFLI